MLAKNRYDLYDLLGERAAVSAEVLDYHTALLLQAVGQPFKRVRLTELDIGIAVTVLDIYDETSYGGYAGEISVRVLLVRCDELVVKVKIDAVPRIDLAGGGETLQKQRVHLLVYVEGVGLLLAALVGDAVLGEDPQSPEDDIR